MAFALDPITMTTRIRPFPLLFLLTLLVLASPGCGQPQIGGDREVFQGVDALFTAVSMRDNGLLDRSEATLKTLQTAGKLPDAAATRLAEITAEARAGRWEPAQDRLRAFMEGQSRPSSP